MNAPTKPEAMKTAPASYAKSFWDDAFIAALTGAAMHFDEHADAVSRAKEIADAALATRTARNKQFVADKRATGAS